MKVKYYDDTITEENFGTLLEGDNQGQPGYVDIPEIKEVSRDNGQTWKPNPGYDLSKVKAAIINEIKNNDSFRIDLLIYGVIDSLIASETNTKVKAVYTLLKEDAIASLQEYKTKIIENS